MIWYTRARLTPEQDSDGKQRPEETTWSSFLTHYEMELRPPALIINIIFAAISVEDYQPPYIRRHH